MATLYENLGGDGAVNAAVELFYRKVLSDARVSSFFGGVDMDRQRAKQKAFLTMVFGGPRQYSGKGLRHSHAKLVQQGLNDEHFDVVVQLLGETLVELGVAGELIEQVRGIAESTRADVLSR